LELEDAIVAERPDASSSLRDKEKVWEPSACAAFAKAVVPIRLMLIGPAEGCFRRSEMDLETSGMSVTEGAMVGTEVGAESGQTRNVTLWSTQSINGLCWVSQSSPSTARKSESNWVTKYLME